MLDEAGKEQLDHAEIPPEFSFISYLVDLTTFYPTPTAYRFGMI